MTHARTIRMTSSLIPLLCFAVVIVLIPIALWVFKHTPLGASLSGHASHGVLRAVGMLALSPTQKLLVIEVGHGAGCRWLVLGVTSSTINVLHTMEPQAPAPAEAPTPGEPASEGAPFEEFLGKLRQTKGGGNVH
jgi:flagellar protein FliO/FliZ